MIKPIDDFTRRFNVRLKFDKKMVVERQGRYFLLNATLKKLIAKEFFYAGTYLGKAKRGKFFPSFSLLRLMALTSANKIFINRKTEWLFICGRDVFKEGIVKMSRAMKKGDQALVLNDYGECVGFGMITGNTCEDKQGVFVSNILDIGDFLRRERI